MNINFSLIIYFISSNVLFAQNDYQKRVENFARLLIDGQPKNYAYEFDQVKVMKYFTEKDTAISNDHIILIKNNEKRWLKKTGSIWQTLIRSDSTKEIYDFRDSTIYFSKDDGSLSDIIETFPYGYHAAFYSQKVSFDELDTLTNEFRITINQIPDTNSLVSNYRAIITVSKKDLLPVSLETFMDYEGMHQYVRWSIHNIKKIEPDEGLMVFDKSLKVKKMVNCREGRILADFTRYSNDFIKQKILYTFLHDTVDLLKLKPKLVLLDFFYSGCPPCRKAIPVLNSVYARYKSENIVIIGVDNIDDREHLDALLKAKPINYPVVCSKTIEEQFTITSYPTLLVFDGNLRFVKGIVGYNDEMERELTTLIKEYLK